MYCPQCGLNNKDGETVCSGCGTPLPTTPPRKQNVFVRFLKAVLMCVLALAVFFGCQTLVAIGYSSMYMANLIISGEAPLSETDPAWVEISEQMNDKISENTTGILLVSNLLTVLILCLGYTLKKKSPARELDVKGINPLRYVSIAIFGMALQVFILVTLNFIPFPEAVYAEHDAAFADLGGTGNLFLELLSVGLVTGIAEELVFRGMILKYLKRVIPSWAAVIISAVVFGLVHGSLLSMIYATVVGLVLGTLYVKFDSIIPAIICHVFFNSMSSLLTLIPPDNGMINFALYITSIPVIFYLAKSLFFKYPTVSDLLFDSKNRIKPKNAYEAAVINDMNALKKSGEITEADLRRLDFDWERAKKNQPNGRIPTTDNSNNAPDETGGNDNENGGNSNEAL